MTTRVAAGHLGVHPDTFKEIAESEDWIRPVRIGTKVMWGWEQVLALRIVLLGRAAVGKMDDESSADDRPPAKKS